jgi:hypothetical protein
MKGPHGIWNPCGSDKTFNLRVVEKKTVIHAKSVVQAWTKLTINRE